jgi:hypothetical protein
LRFDKVRAARISRASNRLKGAIAAGESARAGRYTVQAWLENRGALA